MKWVNLKEIFEKKGIRLFSVEELAVVAGCSKLAALRLAQRYTRKGIFSRLKKGLYVVMDAKPPDLYLANKIYYPSYISLETALAYYHIIPETVYTCTSVTYKITRQFETTGKVFTYYSIKQKAFVGYEPVKIAGYTVLMAEPEKALADFLYFVSLGKKTMNERLDLSQINKRKLVKYVNFFKRPGLLKIMKRLFL